MTDPPIIVVYCDGPPDAAHKRYSIPFKRVHLNSNDPPGIWSQLGRGDKVHEELNDELRGMSRPQFASSRLRLRCPRCRFNEIRNDDHRQAVSAMFTVFDGLVAGSEHEISIRELADQIGR